jgi:signal transduction histidine kinase
MPPPSARTGHPIPAFVRLRRSWLLVLGLWAAAVGFALNLHIDDIRRQSIQVATAGARNMFRMVVLTRSWNSSHGGVYVPVTPTTQPNPYLDHPRREITTTDGQTLTLINPAYMTRLIAEMAKSDSGSIFRLTSLRPVRPQNAPDDWERRALQSFEAGAKEAQSVEDTAQGKMLRYMAPLVVLESCLHCHARQGYQLGDVRGGISVSQNYDQIDGPTRVNVRQAFWSYGLIFVLVSALGWWLLELLRQRWFDLSGKIRELEATRGELVQSEKMASLGRMVAGFAHEINTPVGVAVGAVSQHAEILQRIDLLLQQEEVSEQDLREELSSLQSGSQLALGNLQRTANLVQSFKRTSIDQSSDQLRDFQMKELVQDVLFVLNSELKRGPIRVSVQCPDAIHLHGAPGLIEQVLTNLTMNAIQHGFDSGQREGAIEIAVALEHDQVHLRFADNGNGMNPEQLARIFEPFYTTKRKDGGSGLGLYICYNIVTAKLGGSIQCHSTPGAGSRFDIRFPAVFAAERTQATP